jgi:hypothetical protein
MTEAASSLNGNSFMFSLLGGRRFVSWVKTSPIVFLRLRKPHRLQAAAASSSLISPEDGCLLGEEQQPIVFLT